MICVFMWMWLVCWVLNLFVSIVMMLYLLLICDGLVCWLYLVL